MPVMVYLEGHCKTPRKEKPTMARKKGKHESKRTARKHERKGERKSGRR